MHDIVIVGGGAAGLSAAIYATRAMVDTLVIERSSIGGNVSLIVDIENYLGFPHISGDELVRRFEEHASEIKVKIETDSVMSIKKDDNFVIKSPKNEYVAKKVIIATGMRPRKLGVMGEDELLGRGVSYCATCDGPLFAGGEVAVIGGGNSALTEAIFLSNIASKVYIIHRRGKLRADPIYQKRAHEKQNIEFILNSVVHEIKGDKQVESMIISTNGVRKELKVDGVFIYIGNVPNTEMVNCEKDNNGFILTDENMMSSIEGMYAAGDCRAKHLRQITTAVCDGAIAGWHAANSITQA
ncbi:thioredoxin-disulfide reductase [Methanosarcinales archaeon]|nr:MAG: thioredoxin-disulfide reductase [Methanosarcinales archaeon]